MNQNISSPNNFKQNQQNRSLQENNKINNSNNNQIIQNNKLNKNIQEHGEEIKNNLKDNEKIKDMNKNNNINNEQNLIQKKEREQSHEKQKPIYKKIKDLHVFTHVGFDGEHDKENNQDNYFIQKNFAGHKDYI